MVYVGLYEQIFNFWFTEEPYKPNMNGESSGGAVIILDWIDTPIKYHSFQTETTMSQPWAQCLVSLTSNLFVTLMRAKENITKTDWQYRLPLVPRICVPMILKPTLLLEDEAFWKSREIIVVNKNKITVFECILQHLNKY